MKWGRTKVRLETIIFLDSTAELLEFSPVFKGIGFIQDLALSSNARSGIIGDSGRSSFMLLAEIIEYDRRIDDWKRGRDSPDSIPRCQLPSRFGRLGYNYGPGTPTFIGERTHEPMEPMQAFNQYKKHHSVEGVKLEYLADAAIPNRLFAIGHIPCPLNDLSDQVHAFLNGKHVLDHCVPPKCESIFSSIK
jgi:hypothetical protein